MEQGSSIAEVVREGLTRREKRLPHELFYDEAGSTLFERITELPEYYLTRSERSIFLEQGEPVLEEALPNRDGPVAVLELGAGTAEKSELLLAALLRRGNRVLYLPADIAPAPLDAAARRLSRSLPELTVKPIVAPHVIALERARGIEAPLLVLFIGSSIGNYARVEAVRLLAQIRDALGPTGALLLGTDLRKSTALLLSAYDDAAGVTAAFNLNLLTRINRELNGQFDLSRFKHVALWNADESRIEMHLESCCEQRVRLRALELEVSFARGERIHTENSHKYDLAGLDRMFAEAGLGRQRTFTDKNGWFGTHVAKALAAGASGGAPVSVPHRA